VPGNVPRESDGESSFRCAGTTPQAPCTEICISIAPMARSTAELEKAHRNATGTPNKAAMMEARLRPMRWLKLPKAMPPMIAAML